jgi:23S rRNA pseudouridine2605 synthase
MTERSKPRRARDGAPGKGTAGRKGTAKRATARDATAKKGAWKSVAKRGTGKPAAGRTTVGNQSAAKQTTARKTVVKKTVVKKTVAKKPVAQRASEERAARRREATGGTRTTGPRSAATRTSGTRSSGTRTPATRATRAGARPAPSRRTAPRNAPAPVHDPNGVRLQRVLAAAGLGSRRACEALIDEGRVEVDGAIVVDQGLRVDPATAVIHVDGLRVASAPDHVYLLLNKPVGVVSTMSDPEGRITIADYLGGRDARLFHVGRLDADTEGLILLTNDGDLAHRLSHPSFGVRKTYLAEITGPVARDVGRRLKAGIELEDGPATVDSFRLVSTVGSRVMVELSLHEGRKHIVRRMLAEVGHPVTRLVRTDLGPISLGNLKPGKQRKLSQQEVGALYQAVGL